MQKRAAEFEQNPDAVRAIINEGNEAASEVARDTMDEVRKVMGLAYS